MHPRKTVNRILVLLVLAAMLFTNLAAVTAQNPGQGGGDKWEEKIKRAKEKKAQRITQAQRQAAADRAKAQGFVLPKLGVTPSKQAKGQAQAAAEVQPFAIGDAPHYFSHPNYANSPYPVATALGTCSVTPDECAYDTDCPSGETCVGAVFDTAAGMRKFVDPLPWAPGGDPLPVAAKTVMADGSEYYEIGLVQYSQQLHADLPPTLLRGYVQLKACSAGGIPLSNEMLDGTLVPTGFCGATAPTYLGPTIVAQKGVPVRITFRNLLPVGSGGDLFVPTDVSVMGAGMGPDLHGMPEVDPQNPTCQASPKPAGCFTENRANLHLHGGLTPWISDGTPHQWITPNGETLPYPDANLLADAAAPDHQNAVENKGVSVDYVPDMWFDAGGNLIASCTGQPTCATAGATINPGQGAQTYYYTNQQSARLLFYHDHAWGITRLNVYAGEAAPYLIQDATETALTSAGGALDGLGIGIPLVIQDKTFVPSPEQLAVSDNTWDTARWGDKGDLWIPHVYSPAQNPGDISGVNQFGRWAYGPWFWPPTLNIAYGPIDNPYYCGWNGLKQDGVTPCSPACDPDDPAYPDGKWCEPAKMPGAPYNSMGMEAFNDTPMVNGKAYPTLTLAPGEYRFRVLNAANDRFFNLSLYQADPAAPTEVQLNPAEVAAALEDATIFPTPLVGTEGPAWVQIGTEGGFLPAPVVVPAQPTTWVNDPTVFNAGNVDKHSLLLGPAERADVVVDLTDFAGKTLILYNDAPAAFPARDPRYDYYTGNGDYRDTGGTPPTLPGYGPNIRTVMQIVVSGSGGAATPNAVNATRLANLQAAFAHKADNSGVFESSQHPIIVGQSEYNSAYGTAFSRNDPTRNGTVKISDTSLTFFTLPQTPGGALGTVTLGLGPKQIQDEMGEAFDPDYGRMGGFLGLESPNPQAGGQNMILYPYVNPVSELINATTLPRANIDVTPISVANDGTQIWKVTHNGVDTHPIHFHLFDVQVINRVGWDGIIRKPDLTELGWKETVRISPLEDTIVALRPVIPVTPFDAKLPISTRPLNPAMPTGSSLMFRNMDYNGDATVPIVNVWTNFGWEYVWHCHILSHEEMDMMRPIAVSAPPASAPQFLTGSYVGNQHSLTWQSPAEGIGFNGYLIQRAVPNTDVWTDLATVDANVTSYAYTPPDGNPYSYRVIAVNAVGYGATAGYSTMTTQSGPSNVVTVQPPLAAPAAPSNVVATVIAGPAVQLTWTDNATNESGFVVERCTGAGCTSFTQLTTMGPRVPSGNMAYTDSSVVAGQTYIYRVAAVRAGAPPSAWVVSNEVTVPVGPAVPAAPSNVTATGFRGAGNWARVRVTWTDNANNETGFRIQRANDANFTSGVTTVNVGANTTTYSTGLLPRGTSYYFRVQSYNASGSSAYINAAPFPVTTP